MEKLQQLKGVAAPLPRANIDTDIITPMKYLTSATPDNLHDHTFEPLRFMADGSENPDFILNKPGYRDSVILIAGRNFGCGSSRETAVWGIKGMGIRCVIAESFGDIFFNNCFKNGILPIKLAPDVVERLMKAAERGANATMTVDLENQEITDPDGGTIPFDAEAFRKHCLLNGLDDIGITMEKVDRIDAFEAAHNASQSWLYA